MRRQGTGDKGQGTEPRAAGAPRGSGEPTEQARRAISIVGVSFLNARPLVAGLEAGISTQFPYTYHAAPPTVCAEEFRKGRAEVALLPVGSLPRLASPRLVPTLGIACRGRVRSVLLVSKVAVEKIGLLAVHSVSDTSVALAQTLLVERWRCRPQVVRCAPPLETMLAEADAAVVIGDPALAFEGRSGLLEIDLGAAWLESTGLPFVFAVWGLADGVSSALASALEASLSYGLEHREQLLPRWAAEHGFSVDTVRDYLQERLHHRLGEDEHRGLQEFLERAARAGVLPAFRPSWLPRDPGRAEVKVASA